MNDKKRYCNNCGREGHLFAECKDAITSMGVICISSSEQWYIDFMKESFVQSATSKHDKREIYDRRQIYDRPSKLLINIQKTSNCYLNNSSCLKEHLDKIKFLIVQRKSSLGYIEFIRGRYDVQDYHHIIRLFQQMQQHEIDKISKFNFDELWDDLWQSTAKLKIHRNDYVQSKEKFEILKNAKNDSDKGNILSLSFYVKTIEPEFTDEEWGFPKGRRNFYESNINCSVREFKEETGYANEQFTLLDSIIPLYETFKGTNGINYRHIYYIAILNEPYSSDKIPLPIGKRDMMEIGALDWVNYSTSIQKIRKYHVAKKEVLNDIFRFLTQIFICSESVDKKLSVYGPKTVHDLQLPEDCGKAISERVGDISLGSV